MSDTFDPSNYDIAPDGPINQTYDTVTADGDFTADDGYATATAAESEQWDAWRAESDLDQAQGEAWYEGDTDAYYAYGEAEAGAHEWGQEASSAEIDATYSDYDSSSYDSSSYDSSASYDSSYDSSY